MKRLIVGAIVAGVTAVAMLMVSCNNNTVASSVTIASIHPSYSLAVNPQNGDTLVITGSNFGGGGSVVFTPSVFVASGTPGCPEWTASEIRVVIPQSALAGDVYVASGGKNSNLYNVDILWPHYSNVNGLADSIVRTITIDNQNNKWCGTDKGLSEFDGVHWTTFTTQNGLPGDNVSCSLLDRRGDVWVGTSAGAAEFNGSTWKSFVTSDGLISNNVLSIACDDSNNIWFGTDYGVSEFNGTRWVTYQYSDSTLSNNSVASIAIDKQGHKWFGTWGYGASEFYNDTMWKTYTPYNNTLSGVRVYCEAVDSQGVVWFGTFVQGASKYDGAKWTSYNAPPLPDFTVEAIAFDSQKNTWFGTYNGLAKYNGTNWTIFNTNNGLVNNIIYAMAFDKNGYLWIGTNGGGVSQANFH